MQTPQSGPAVAPTVTTGAATAQPVVATLPAAFPLLTRRDIAALREQRQELSDQLVSASSRRSSVAKQLNGVPPGPVRSGLEQRIVVLDNRIAQLESDIATTGRQLTSASAGLAGTTSESWRPGLNSDNVMVISNVFIIFVLAPMALAAARMMWKRGNKIPVAPASAENTRRLDQLQQAVDTIAIEVERVSEGQRFVTKLLSESAPVAIGAGARAPDSVESSGRI